MTGVQTCALPIYESLIAVPLFVLMGNLLERTKISEGLLSSMSKLFCGMRGGLGVSVCVVGALLAASTGIVDRKSVV